MANITYNIYGTLAWSDGASESFSEFFDGSIAGGLGRANGEEWWNHEENNFPASNAAEGLLDTAARTITSLVVTKAAGTARTLSDVSAHMYGVVAFDDGSNGSFSVEFDNTRDGGVATLTDHALVNLVGNNTDLNRALVETPTLETTLETSFTNLVNATSTAITV